MSTLNFSSLIFSCKSNEKKINALESSFASLENFNFSISFKRVQQALNNLIEHVERSNHTRNAQSDDLNHIGLCLVAAAHAASCTAFECALVHHQVQVQLGVWTGCDESKKSSFVVDAMQLFHDVMQDLCKRLKVFLNFKLPDGSIAMILDLDYSSKLAALDIASKQLQIELKNCNTKK